MKTDILARLRSQAEQVEVLSMTRVSTKVSFEANRLKSSRVEETGGVAVRVVKDGRLGFAASSDAGALEKLAGNVLESAAYGDAIPIQFPAQQPAPAVQTYDSTIAGLPISRLVEIGQAVMETIAQAEPGLRVDVEVNRSVQNVSIRNQAGAAASFERTPLSIMASFTRIDGDDVLAMYDYSATTKWQDDITAGARRLCDRLKLAKRTVAMRSGRMPVLFTPTGALALILPLNTALNGKSVHTGISPLKGKIGQKLFDARISIVDDGAVDGRPESAPFDDEAVPHRRNVLIEDGVLRSFYYDLKTAAQDAVASTGNGSRGLFNAPSPSETNLLMQAGDVPLASIAASMDEGLIVHDVLGLGQGNIVSGAFSNPVLIGFKVEKGEIVGRVKDVSIAGNIYELLDNVAAISQETEWVYGNYCVPSILLPAMNVVAKG